ncbi:MAG: diguanylate cyclase [Rhodospirillaceae bacterium]
MARLTDDLHGESISVLINPSSHTPLVQRRRALMIISRVRWVAMTFAVLTPIWIVIDVLMFPWPLSGLLTGLRIAATIAFTAIALGYRSAERPAFALMALGSLLAIPCFFFIISVPMITSFDLSPMQQVFASGYAFLPFVMVAGIAVFPITLAEGALFSTPLILSMAGVAFMGFNIDPFNYYLGALWLLVLLATVATLAGMSQLHFMSALVNQAAHDALTKCYNRRVGEELLDVQANTAIRTGLPMSLAFVDLDNFKSVNDRFGHDEGDKTLRRASEAFRKILRRGDIVVRWGGEEFLLVMPNTDGVGALRAVERIHEITMGKRPDGTFQTASIGISELLSDECRNWSELVEIADKRMYMAKQSGRNRTIGLKGETSVFEMADPDQDGSTDTKATQSEESLDVGVG